METAYAGVPGVFCARAIAAAIPAGQWARGIPWMNHIAPEAARVELARFDLDRPRAFPGRRRAQGWRDHRLRERST